MVWRVGMDFKKKANSEFHTLCSYVLQTEMLDMQQRPLAFKRQFWKYKTKSRCLFISLNHSGKGFGKKGCRSSRLLKPDLDI